MKYLYFYGSPVFFLLALLLLFSCAGLPPTGFSPPGGGEAGSGPERSPVEKPEVSAAPAAPPEPALRGEPELPREILPPAEGAPPPAAAGPQGAGLSPPEQLRMPPVPENILGRGLAAPEKLAAFLLLVNPGADPRFTKDLAETYVDEAGIEGVNHDAAFAQMCLETGFLKFGGIVTPEMNNFCGLGSIGPDQPGEWFPDSRTGVRAHIQHLKVYATPEPLKQELVDPRYHRVRPGSSPGIGGLAGTWAADRAYGDKIKNILTRLYEFSLTE